MCLYVRQGNGHAAILPYFGYSLCACVYVCVHVGVCVCIPLSLPQMMTLSAVCPSNVSAEAAGTVW